MRFAFTRLRPVLLWPFINISSVLLSHRRRLGYREVFRVAIIHVSYMSPSVDKNDYRRIISPILLIQREAATPPIEHSLNYLCELASLRLHRLEPKHPLRLRTWNASASNSPTRLERMAIDCASMTQYTNPFSGSEPWNKHYSEERIGVFKRQEEPAIKEGQRKILFHGYEP